MSNIVDFVKSNIRNFEEQPLSQVDSLVLSAVSYFRLPKEMTDVEKPLSFRDMLMAEHLDYMLSSVYNPPQSRELIFALAASPRYRSLRLVSYKTAFDQEQEKQFAGVTFINESQVMPFGYVAYRGTDSTLVGWKEDFNMAFQHPVPAQEDGEAYLREMMGKYSNTHFYVGGHSKGGNVAVYSSVKVSALGKEYANRIVNVFSHDGPGFNEEFLGSEEYSACSKKILKTVPQSSVIGMIMESQENYQVVKSNGFSLWQHDFFTWEVLGDDFVTEKALDRSATIFDKGLNQWLASYTVDDRSRFIDRMYDIFQKSGVETTRELKANYKDTLPKVYKAAKDLPEQERKFLASVIRALGREALRNLPPDRLMEIFSNLPFGRE